MRTFLCQNQHDDKRSTYIVSCYRFDYHFIIDIIQRFYDLCMSSIVNYKKLTNLLLAIM